MKSLLGSGRVHAPRPHARRALLSMVSLVLAVAPIVGSSNPQGVGASGSPNLSLSEDAPQTVLYGTDASVSLTASNPSGGDWGYNLTFEDVLPAGVSYVSGSTTPSTVGDPQILSNEPVTNETVLIWSNVSDLSPGSGYTLGFTLAATTDTVAGEDPVPPYFLPNDSYTDSSSAYVNSDPRYVPQFSAGGTSSNYTGSATASGTTALSPLAISQGPSGAELRGVHDHQFVSTITVTNNHVHATDNISVTDWLPAGLEYLLCGQTDNTTDAPTNPDGGQDEYPGSGPISGQISSPADCVTPTTVATEDTDPDGGGELPTAVYTEIQWTGLGNLAPGASTTLKFVTAIPIRANTMTWSTGSAPGTGSPFPQAANLNNNSGVETVDGTSLTIYATATGTYTGTLGSGVNPIEATAYDTIIARDIITSKAVSDGTFTQGDVVTYTITVSTSEYRVSDDTTVTDTLPSGLCPLGGVNYDAHSDPQCAPSSDEPSPAYASVTENADGTFTIVWDLDHMDNNATDTITFPAVDRGYYQADDQDTAPTVGNDTLTNTEVASGNLTVICGDGDPDCTDGDTGYISHDTPITVDDVTATASASQSAAGPTLSVYVAQSLPAGDSDCADVTDWLSSSSTEADGYPPTYQDGDMICFEIDVSYPPGTDFKNPAVTDFIPPNSAYVTSSQTTTSDNSADSVSFTTPASDELQWTMGDELPDPDGNLYEAPDTYFQVQFAVVATANPPVGNDFQLTQDLAKLVTSNTGGTTFTDRGLVTYQLAAPIVTLSKAVTSIDGSTAGVTPTGDTVRGGDDVGYTVTVTDTGIVDADGVEVWDELPVQVDCATDVTDILPDTGSCVTGSGGDLIEWPPDAVPELGPGDAAELTFTVQIPTTAGAGEGFDNEAGVRSFTGENNQGGDNVFYPDNDIDPTITSGSWNAPEADDAADVTSAGAVVAKSAVVTSTNSYASGSDATVGDEITYTVEVTVPHDTTFYDASLSDPLSDQQDYVANSGQVTEPGGSFTEAEGSDADGFSYAYDSGTDTVTVTFPTTYANATSTDEVVTVQFSVTVADVSANERNDQISNVATLTDHTSTGAKVTASDSPVKTNIVEPDVAISKTVNPTRIQPGGTNTFTITVTNPTGTGVSTAWDIAGTDTIPTSPSPGLTYVASSLTVSGPSTGPAATTAESGGVVSWSIPELKAGQTVTITYQVIPPSSDDMTNGESWENTATLTSWCAVDNCATVPGARSYGSTDSEVNLPAEFPTLSVTKSAPGGSTALDDTAFTWKVVVTNEATVAVANSVAVTDTLPPNWVYDTSSTTIAPQGGSDSYTDPTVTVNAGGDVLSWTGLGTLNAGKSLTITYTATPEVSPLTTGNTGPSHAYPNSAYATATDNTGSPGNGTVSQYTSTTSTADAYIGDADLQITKSHTGNFSAGADGTYSLVVKNNGPSSAGAAITVSDPIVSPETYASASGSNTSYKWGCSYSATTLTVTCTLETPGGSATTLPSGTTAPTLSVVVDTPSSTPNDTQVTNIATVSSPTWDSNTTNNSSSDSTTIDANADLAITKSHTGNFTAGSQGTYTVSIVNNGPSDAQGTLTVTDTLPAGESLVSATGTDWTCGTPTGGQFTCTDPNTLTSGAYTPPITEVVDVAASQVPGSITNSAAVSSPTNDPVSSNNTSNNATTIATSADLALTKVHEGSFVAGEDGTYDFTVTNSDGPSNAAAPTVTDTLPTGETLVSGGGDGSGWACSASAGTVTCTDASALGVGGTTSFTMTVAIASGVTVSTLENTATVSSATSDPVSSNNSSTDDAGTTQSADLQVVKSLTSSLVAGQQATYSLSVSDSGPSDAAGPVTLTDTLPSGESYVSATGTGWSCSASSGTVTCTHSTSIVAGAEASVVTLTVALASDVLPQSISNTASVSSSTPDPDAGNNTSTTINSSSTSADLSISKTDDGPFTAGGDGEYHIVVSNAGPSDAQATIVVTDTLPSGETYVNASGTGWSCSDSGQVVTCDHGSALPDGQSAATIDLEVAVSASLHAASVTNDAGVSSPTSDPDPTNNSTTDTTTIDTSADLAITKTHGGDFTAGSDGTYSLVVTNDGPSDAVLPTVTDDVPSPLVLVSAEGGSNWDCSSTGNDVSCTAVANLPAGDTAATIPVEVSVRSSQLATRVTNTASVTSTTPDPVEGNNSSSDATSIVTSADLTLTKVHQGRFTAGTDGSYLITAGNLGPSDATGGLTVSDTLPSVESYVSGTGTDWSCSATGQVVTCTNPDTVPSGESASPLTLTVAIASSATGEVSNSASVVSATPAPSPDDNSGSDTTTLALSSDLSITKSHAGDFTAGLDGTYTIGVHNAGPSASGTGIVVTDTLPAGESFVSATGTGWSCAPSGQSVNCTQAASIPVTGDAPALQITVAVASGAVGTLTNVAQVQGPNPDPNLDNNTASDPATSQQVFNLSLAKTLVGQLVEGKDGDYSLAVTNAGPSDSTSPVVLTDPLPDGLSFVSATEGTGHTWSCAAAGQTVTCTDSSVIVATTTSTVDITVAVSAAVGAEITNTATVAATGDVDAASEVSAADGMVEAPPAVPDSGAPKASSWPFAAALLLILAGLALAVGSRRRWRPRGTSRLG